jgi:biotin transport system substrate-specific component
MSDATRSLSPHINQGLERSGSLITSTAGRILGAVIFTGLIYVGANIRIPLQPVPITLQTLFVILAGAVLGRGFGALSTTAYLLLGLVGVEIFAGNPVGWAVLAGPTGGYLVGFIAAPLLIGKLIHRRQSIAWASLVFSLGTLLILGLGVLHMTLFFTHDLGLSLKLGLYPFIIGDILKIAAAGSIYRSFIALRSHGTAR